jgi:hypothetical protein
LTAAKCSTLRPLWSETSRRSTLPAISNQEERGDFF